MKHRMLDGFLLVTLLVGGVLAWQSGRERSRWMEWHARLARATGDLVVADPSLVHFRALETGDPLHFAWRVYFPANYSQILSGSTGGVTRTGSSRRATEFLARVRFRPDDCGVIQVYTHFANGSSRSTLGDKELAELLRDRWDKIRVEQVGAPKLAVIKPDQHAVLLRLTLADELQVEARKKLSAGEQQQFVPVLFELDLGPKP